jgi:hypothetical protein
MDMGARGRVSLSNGHRRTYEANAGLRTIKVRLIGPLRSLLWNIRFKWHRKRQNFLPNLKM